MIPEARKAEGLGSFGTGYVPFRRLTGLNRACAVALMIGVGACGSERPTGSAGASAWVYKEWPDLEVWELKERIRVGDDDVSPFGAIQGTGIMPDGRLLVIDGHTQAVMMFSSAGEPLPNLATSGQGPGEVLRANGLHIGDDGTVWINDPGSGRILSFDSSGAANTHPRVAFSDSAVWPGVVDEDQWIWDLHLSPSQPFPAGRGFQTMAFDAFVKGVDATDRTKVDSARVGVLRDHSLYLPGGAVELPLSPRFLFALDPGGFVWTGRSDEFVLTKQTLKGDTVATLTLPHPDVPLDPHVRAAAIADIETSMTLFGDIDVDYDEILATRAPAIESLKVDNRSRLWVGTTGEEGIVEFVVVAPDGRPIARATGDFSPSPAISPTVRDSTLLAVVEGPYGIQQVVRAVITTAPDARPDH